MTLLSSTRLVIMRDGEGDRWSRLRLGPQPVPHTFKGLLMFIIAVMALCAFLKLVVSPDAEASATKAKTAQAQPQRYSCAPPPALEPSLTGVGGLMYTRRTMKVGNARVLLELTLDGQNLRHLGVRSSFTPRTAPLVQSASDMMSLQRQHLKGQSMSNFDRCLEGNRTNEIVGGGYSRQAYWWLSNTRHTFWLVYTVNVVTNTGPHHNTVVVKLY